MPVVITLTPSELIHAATAGVHRQVQNLKLGRRDRYGAGPDDAWRIHIGGASAECAVAKFLGVYWDGMGALGDLHALDVRGVQVRWAMKPTHRLIVHEADADALPFVLVTGDGFQMTLQGWIQGAGAKRPQFVDDPVGGRPAFFVPQDELLAIETLKHWLEAPELIAAGAESL